MSSCTESREEVGREGEGEPREGVRLEAAFEKSLPSMMAVGTRAGVVCVVVW